MATRLFALTHLTNIYSESNHSSSNGEAKYKCCLFLYLYFILGNHSLYVSFDTLENLTLMEGNERMNFDALVPGWVQIVLF